MLCGGNSFDEGAQHRPTAAGAEVRAYEKGRPGIERVRVLLGVDLEMQRARRRARARKGQGALGAAKTVHDTGAFEQIHASRGRDRHAVERTAPSCAVTELRARNERKREQASEPQAKKAHGHAAPKSSPLRVRRSRGKIEDSPMQACLSLSVAIALSMGCGCIKATEPSAGPPGLEDESRARGIEFFAARGENDYFMPDSMGPGCALFDADGDGDLDAFFVQGIRAADGKLQSEAGRDRLLLQAADGKFSDASANSGVDDPRYGMGTAVADVDGDGDLDLFVSNYGSSRLYLNRGNATFEDATEAFGIAEEGWAASAGFFDYDADGRPDLFVVRYLEFDIKIVGADSAGQPDYPSPLAFKGLPARLWHNEGGRFRDVSRESGISSGVGRGLGLAFTDLDGDGRMDVFVANDSEPNFAWIQSSPGHFENRAFAMGLAVNRVGRPQANMGVTVGDCDGDGTLELFITHLVAETNILYRKSGEKKYSDATEGSGLGGPSLDLTGFGTSFADIENDGDLDLLVVNGRIMRRGPHGAARLSAHWLPYAEENQLYFNDGTGQQHSKPTADIVSALAHPESALADDSSSRSIVKQCAEHDDQRNAYDLH